MNSSYSSLYMDDSKIKFLIPLIAINILIFHIFSKYLGSAIIRLISSKNFACTLGKQSEIKTTRWLRGLSQDLLQERSLPRDVRKQSRTIKHRISDHNRKSTAQKKPLNERLCVSHETVETVKQSKGKICAVILPTLKILRSVPL